MFSLNDIEFASPNYFWLFAIIPLLVVFYIWRYHHWQGSVRFSSTAFFSPTKSSIEYLHMFFPVFRLAGISFLIIGLARPQSSTSWQNVTTEGIDIIISMDISGSMLAEDFKPNRLEASKTVAMEFIDGRPSDRMGLVVFSGECFTQCPITSDHAVLKNLFADIKNGMILDGTAIGLGLATAVNRLKDSEAKSKVIIILTDGFNTSGSIPPLTAAEIAKTFGIRVYTIGVGTNGMAPYPFKNPFGGTVYQNVEVKIDEKLMGSIADMTGGKYFRATDNNKLREIYAEIDKLEKSRIEVTEFRRRNETFLPWVVAGLLILVAEYILSKTLMKSLT